VRVDELKVKGGKDVNDEILLLRINFHMSYSIILL